MFTVWGIVAAFLWVPVCAGLFVGIKALGIGVAQSTVAGCIVLGR